jgi:hypothetical protein
MNKLIKILKIILEEIRNQVINLLYILIIDFIVLLIDKYYYPFLTDFNFLERNYISLTISFIIFLCFLPILLPHQTRLMMKWNKRNQHIKKNED